LPLIYRSIGSQPLAELPPKRVLSVGETPEKEVRAEFVPTEAHHRLERYSLSTAERFPQRTRRAARTGREEAANELRRKSGIHSIISLVV